MNFEEIRKRLGSLWGRKYWRSLEEVAGAPEFEAFLQDEFPQQARPLPDELSRREFLKLMGASMLLAGLGGCSRQPLEQIVPYVKTPEDVIPGKPLFYATAVPFNGFARGVLVETHDGRPTKLEGNPEHPASLGAMDIFAQASLLTLYDPDRSQVVLYGGQISTWPFFYNALSAALENEGAKQGAGLRILTDTITSPSTAAMIQKVLAKFPKAKWHHYSPINQDQAMAGAKLAFGEAVETLYAFDKAEVVVSFDHDFLSEEAGSIRYARDFASKRRVRNGENKMNRLYVAESAPSSTGVAADHRFALSSSEVTSAVYGLAAQLGIKVKAPAQLEAAKKLTWLTAMAKDLRAHKGAGVVTAGENQPAEVHALIHAINHELGNAGKTVLYTEPVQANTDSQIESLKNLAAEMNAGKVETLLVLGANPIYEAPADLNFAAAYSKVPLRIHQGLYQDETAVLSHWHIPVAHPLESWGDVRAYDGTTSIHQPMIEPLYGGKTALEILSFVAGENAAGYGLVRDYWQNRLGLDFESAWRRALHDGLIKNSAAAPKSVSLKSKHAAPSAAAAAGEFDVVFRPDPTVWDGKPANNGWLQELPKPITKLTWDNAVMVSPKFAEKHALKTQDVVELTVNGRKLQGPVWVLPGQPENTVTLHLGYGRTQGGKVGMNSGFNAYAVRSSNGLWHAAGSELRKTGKEYLLASTQHHHSMEGRDLVRAATLADYVKNPKFAQEMELVPGPELSFYKPYENPDYAWGMAIDLNTCLGCNACVIACQAENNIPVVGKDQVSRGRAMHWMRIDRYYSDDLDDPQILTQPILCMHCEQAPCEPVCPVGATTHSEEGLNTMTYNRCVGTKYCSNNCPYKVRRFNWYEYIDKNSETLKLMRNPNVTVRARGVMEKCTYCVQRINHARIEAKKQDRKIRDGEIVTACQAACPSQAITFGNIKDSNAEVSKAKAEPRNYGLLTELGTRPRTTYLAKLTNPNPEIHVIETGSHGTHH